MRSGYPGLLRTSSQGGLILYFGNNPIAVNGHGNATPVVAKHVWGLYAKDRSGALARDEALAWMKENPGQVLWNAPKKAYFLWLASPQGFGWLAKRGEHAPNGLPPQIARAFRFAAHAQSLAVLGLGLFGLLAWRPPYRFWTLILAAHLAMWCLLASSPRNRYPLEPFLLLSGAALVVSRREGSRGRPQPAA
jgi:hypothetical protein